MKNSSKKIQNTMQRRQHSSIKPLNTLRTPKFSQVPHMYARATISWREWRIKTKGEDQPVLEEMSEFEECQGIGHLKKVMSLRNGSWIVLPAKRYKSTSNPRDGERFSWHVAPKKWPWSIVSCVSQVNLSRDYWAERNVVPGDGRDSPGYAPE